MISLVSIFRPVIWYLSAVELFAGVSEADMHRMVSGVVDRRLEKGQQLYASSDIVENVFVLKEGEVTLYQTSGEKKVILDILKPGAVFGNIGFDPATNGPHCAEMTQRGYVCTLPQDYFLQILQRKPEIALRALRVLQKRLGQYQAQIRALSALHARDRILAIVRLLCEKESSDMLPAILRQPMKITHKKIGQMSGLTRETVTKEINKEPYKNNLISAPFSADEWNNSILHENHFSQC